MKFCQKCGRGKEDQCFYTKEGKPQSPCKECTKAHVAAYRAANPDRVAASKKAYSEKNREKIARASRDWRAADPDRARASEIRYRKVNREKVAARKRKYDLENREKVYEAKREWRARNKEKWNAMGARWKRANPERVRERDAEWRLANPEKTRAYSKRWAARNRDKIAAKVVRRDAAKLRAVPLWADRDAIGAVYAQARAFTEELGVPCHVDHVIPLRGANVCGLHVETNLQILTAAHNVRKSNKLLPETVA